MRLRSVGASLSRRLSRQPIKRNDTQASCLTAPGACGYNSPFGPGAFSMGTRRTAA